MANYLSEIAAQESKLAIARFLDDKRMKGEALIELNRLKREMRNAINI